VPRTNSYSCPPVEGERELEEAESSPRSPPAVRVLRNGFLSKRLKRDGLQLTRETCFDVSLLGVARRRPGVPIPTRSFLAAARLLSVPSAILGSPRGDAQLVHALKPMVEQYAHLCIVRCSPPPLALAYEAAYELSRHCKESKRSLQPPILVKTTASNGSTRRAGRATATG
jgi:hypothetical protein